MWYKNIAGRFFGLVTKHACDRRPDRQTDGRTELRLPRRLAASRGKNDRTLKNARHENAGHKKAGPKIAGPRLKVGKQTSAHRQWLSTVPITDPHGHDSIYLTTLTYFCLPSLTV